MKFTKSKLRSIFFVDHEAMANLVRFVMAFLAGLLVLPHFDDAKRTVSVTWNPNCPKAIDCAHQGLEQFPNSVNSLLHFVANEDTASNSSQTVHILFSTVGGPALLMLLTDRNARIQVNWRNYLNESKRGHSVKVLGKVHHSMGVFFTRIWRFNDQNDMVNLDQSNTTEGIALEKLLWKNVTVENGTTLTAALVNSGDGDNGWLLGENATLKVSMQIFDSAGRSDVLPRLPHSDIGCQLDIELINIDTKNFTQPRLAIETATISLAAIDAKEQYKLTEESNIDDEYTPGVFRTYYLTMPGEDGFLMWKPVAYRQSSRSVDSFTRAKHGDVKQVSNTTSMANLTMNNILAAHFGTSFPKHAAAFNTTLGLQKDKFYSNYRYLVWSLGVGWGSKPPETLSPVVIIVLIASLALPTLALFVGVPYLIIRKRRAALPYENLMEST